MLSAEGGRAEEDREVDAPQPRTGTGELRTQRLGVVYVKRGSEEEPQGGRA